MNPNELPRLGPIENWNFDYIGKYVDLAGKRVLCLGYSESEIDRLVAPLNPGSVEVLTLWPDHIDARAGKYPVTIGDITSKTPFSDGGFDAILSLSLLEHVAPLKSAFLEMRRITRPGGDHCHMFGPAWSSAYGSHLYVDEADPMLNFSRWEIPGFMHLLCTPEEIEAFYRDLGYGSATIRHVISQIFFDNHINRVFYDQYIRLFSESFVLLNAEIMTVDVDSKLINLLRAKFPGSTDFATYGGKYHLRIPN